MTVWNREGVQWRQFTAFEMLWLYHRQTYESLRSSHPGRVREYLTETQDFDLLAAFDQSGFKESDL